MPQVSIIIPAYNSGTYLDEAVRSVIAQTFTDWECIVVDDGSTEDLSRIAKMDPRVRLVRQQNRGAPAAARNNAILISESPLIAFLDHDDIWLPGKLALQVTALAAESDCGLCYTAFDIIDSKGNRIGPGWAKPMKTYSDFLREPGGPLPSASVVRRECFAVAGLFDTDYRADDYDLFLKISRHFKMLYLATPELLYRRHSNNTSRDYWGMRADSLRILKAHLAAITLRGSQAEAVAAKRGLRLINRTFGAQAYDAARRCLRERDASGFAVHLLRALLWSPGYTIRSLARFAVPRGKVASQPTGR